MDEPTDETADQPKPDGSRVVTAGAVLVFVAGLVAAGYYFLTSESADDLSKQTRYAFRQGDYETTRTLAARLFEIQPSNDVALMAGESCQKLGDVDAALDWYRKLEAEDTEEFLGGAITLASICSDKGLLMESEEWFRKAIKLRPDDIRINRALGGLLGSEGRRWEANVYLLKAVKLGAFTNQVTLNDVLMLASFEAPFVDEPLYKTAMAAVPDDPIGELGMVQSHFVFNRYDEAIRILKANIAKHPDLLQAHAWLGRSLIEEGQFDEIANWNAALPEAANGFPEVWQARGRWARKVGQPQAAARCFWEALRLEPNSIRSNQELGLTLIELDRSDDAQPFVKRYSLLSDYNKTTHPIQTVGPQVDSLLQSIKLTTELGRPWEKFVWAGALMDIAQKTGAPQSVMQQGMDAFTSAQQDLQSDPPQTFVDSNPALSLNLSDYPLPDWSVDTADMGADAAVTDTGGIRFEDVAAELGVTFKYYNSLNRNTVGMRLFETTGGGVAALDFDLDGWPDLHFTQGAAWPVDPKTAEFSDTLYRSLQGQQFVDVTGLAGLRDVNYGQGIAVGDIDGDGFPDIYLANIGGNRLFRNNGDGTFAEATDSLGERDSRWTTSVLMADLNNDGLPDLFDANYLSGDEVFTKMCGTEIKRACAPSAFEGEQDELFLNNGDGTFAPATASAGLEGVRGKGLGIVAADFDGSGRLNVFVGNDGIENYYWVPTGTGSDFRLTESALERGVALDKDARGQACMGIAVGDFDDSGTLDLFVTNYYDESNTLYALQTGNLFQDMSRDNGLRDPSFQFLGFGTQALDADLDGLSDLVLTNGHIDDYTHESVPFRMRPQAYRNTGGRFVEIKPAPDDVFFNKKQLGRSLARLDFNRDGKPDFVVSHLDTTAAVVQNQTPESGHFLTVRLVGTASARDAHGATVTVETAERTRSLQMVAGGGYQAANENTLNFGLGAAQQIKKLTVRWPSGIEQSFDDVPIDAEVILIEGRAKVLSSVK